PLGVAVLAGFTLVVPLACPPCVLHADRMLAAMTRFHTVTEMGWPFQNNYLVPSLGWYGRPYLYQLVAGLPFGLGWPLAVVALAGGVVALRRHDLADRIALAALLPYFLVICTSRVTFSRHLLPLVPGLILPGAPVRPLGACAPPRRAGGRGPGGRVPRGGGGREGGGAGRWRPRLLQRAGRPRVRARCAAGVRRRALGFLLHR